MDAGRVGSGDGVAEDRPTLRFSRRAVLRRGLSAAGIGALVLTKGRRLVLGPSVSAQETSPPRLAMFPTHGCRSASPGTEISFRNVPLGLLGPVTVVSSETGRHSGVLLPHADGRGASFLPDAPFLPEESVTVVADVPLRSTSDHIRFHIAQPAAGPVVAERRESDRPKTAPQTFRSRPDLRPPVIDVTTPAEGTAPGYVFVGAKIPDGQNGAMILDDRGDLIWFGPAANDVEEYNDVRVQMLQGRPVLTMWEGVSERGHGLGHFVIFNTSYQVIARLQVGNGYPGGDVHEFLITPQGTALVMIYNTIRWDLSPIGGATNGTVIDGIIQELEIETGRVLFEWHSLDHIALDESYSQIPREPEKAVDYVHLNSIEDDGAGHLLISGRHTHAIYKIDRHTGEIRWRLNGKQSDFEMGEGTAFRYQHDARVHPRNRLSLFDNRSSTQGDDAVSRGLVLTLDEEAMTATLASEYLHPTEILSVSQANLQLLPNGNAFVGWGSAPVFSEFGPDGDVRFNGRFPTGGMSYRAYRCEWTGLPNVPPDVAVAAGGGSAVTVYASWNGATRVARWEVLAGPAPDQLELVGSASRTGFETEIEIDTEEPFVAARALDGSGNVLGASTAFARDI